MLVRFWGVRGSIAAPGPDTVRTGGNTTCLEVRTASDKLIIIDGGTGIRPLGLQLLGSLPLDTDIFITHTHWDHIQGLPFFVPLFIPGNKIRFHGAFDPVYQKEIQSILSQQMEYCYFPVREMELKSEVSYHTLREQETIELSDAVVSCVVMNHPVLCYGYRIESGGKSVFFTGDHEPLHNIYEENEDGFEEYQALIKQKESQLHEIIGPVDLLIADSMYLDVEMEGRRGWGHGTFRSTLRMAQACGAKKIAFTHHDPIRSDDQLDVIMAELRAEIDAGKWGECPEVELAKEGLTFAL